MEDHTASRDLAPTTCAATPSALRVEQILDALLERQRSAPQYRARVADLRQHLERRHVAPAIIERIIRLNPDIREGERIRGFHRSHIERDQMMWMCGCTTKGRFIREHGRDAWDHLPRWAIVHQGKRAYVRPDAIADRTWANTPEAA